MSGSKMTNPNMRLVFENAKELLEDHDYNWKAAKLTQSFIRSEVLMSTSQSRLHLPVLITDQTNGVAFNTEKRLQLTDVFIVSNINVQVAKPSSSSAANFDTFNFADLATFASANTASSIIGAYKNGNLSMIVDNDQMLPGWDLEQHYRVPITQAGTNPLLAYAGATTTLNYTNAVDGSNDGIVPNEPNFILTGNSNIDFSMNLINAMTAVEANSRWIIRLRGVLAQNCSKIAS